MKIEVSSFWTQKLGNTPEEYEDDFDFQVTPKGCVAAMSDGATEASFSQKWARLLTHGFVESVPDCWTSKQSKRSYNFSQWLKPLQKEWFAGIDFDKLPWFAVDKAQQGAAASLLGLEINLEKGYWQAMAIGDTNLFILREGKIFSWPLQEYEQFGSSPYLVGSSPEKNVTIAKAMRATGGQVQSGDIFFLMTDALAAMYLKTQFWVNDEKTFEWLVRQSRDDKTLKNDDSTLVMVEIKEV